MTPNPWKGTFFVFDGIDGCGKSKQLELAGEWLGKGIVRPQTIVRTKETNKSGPWGAKIYEELGMAGGWHEKAPLFFQCWYAQDSLMHYCERVIPSLKSGLVVLSDRGRSSMVFGASDSNNIDAVMAVNMAILGQYFIWPDAILIFDVSIETALKRLLEKNRQLDQHEREPILRRVRPNFLSFAEKYPNCHVINAERLPEEIFEDVKKIITATLESKNKPV